MSKIDPQILEPFTSMVSASPHAADLGFNFEGADDGVVSVRLPFRDDLIGDPETRVVHGGVVTALLDHTAGAAGFIGLGGDKALATLDLRIDYMRPAGPDEDIIASARTVRVSGLIAFVEAKAHNGDPDDPIATAHAAFMVTKVKREAVEKAKAEAERMKDES
jgi:uncharacterized protein (TIGR00369 family)